MVIVSPGVSHAIGAPAALIERDESMAALARLLAEATAGGGRFVVIRGEAGIGKTALVRAFLRTHGADVDVLTGTCDGVSTPQPFGPIEDMAGALGPELQELLHRDASRAEVGRWLLVRLSDGRPRIIVVEDVQWADDATLEVLAFLARRMDPLPLLIIVTLRDGAEPTASVTRILGSLATLPALSQLAVGPLTRAGVERLASTVSVPEPARVDPAPASAAAAAGRRTSRLDLDELHRITGGNPFYVSEVLQASGSGIPISVVDAIRARVAGLDRRGRNALEAVAVIGVRAEPWLLAAVAGEDLTGIDDCLAAGLLVKDDGIAFRHELTRMAVLEDLPVVHGIALHRKTLATLERSGATDAARLAYHAEGAADREAIVRYATAAGRRALAMGAHREADAQFRRALRSGDDLAAEERVELLEARAYILHLLNRLDEAYRASNEAVAIRRGIGDPVRLGSSLTFLSLASYLHGDAAEAFGHAEEAIRRLEPLGDSAELARAHSMLGRLGLSSGLGDGGRGASERALEIGRRAVDPEAIATALATIGTVERRRGDREGDEAGRMHLEESLRLAMDAHLPAVVDRAVNNLGVTSQVLYQFQEAERWFIQMEEHSERSEIERCSLYTPRAEMALATGAWDIADLNARASFTAPRTDPIDRCLAQIVLARLALRRGDGDVDAWLTEPIAAAVAMDTTQLRWPLAAVAAERAWLAGTPDEAIEPLRAGYREACDGEDAWAIGELGVWLWRLGALATVDPLAALPYRLEIEGRPLAAAAEWERLEVVYEAALALAGATDPDAVRRAHGMLVDVGAAPVATLVARRLRELGTAVPRGPRPTTRANPGGLTEREAEIARLVAEGLSNAEIADRLVLSARTVGHHVSAVLAKLDVPRRSRVAAAIGAVEARR